MADLQGSCRKHRGAADDYGIVHEHCDIAAAAISEFFTALIITVFVLAAEVLEGMTVSRGRRAIRDLLDFLPRSVTVRRSDGVRENFRRRASGWRLRAGQSGGAVPVDGS